MKGLVSISLLCLFCTQVVAQEGDSQTSTPYKNIVGCYLGVIEYNVHYERNVAQSQKSYMNLRVGFGFYTELQNYSGHYLNPSLVYLTGKKNSHFELNLGGKFMVFGDSEKLFFPDIFVGYRYEEPEKGGVLRVGIGSSLIVVGGGLKF